MDQRFLLWIGADGAVDAGHAPVEGSDRQMAGLAGDRYDEAIDEADVRPSLELDEGGPDCVGILHHKAFVLQQHFDHEGDSGRCQLVNRSKHPYGLGEHEMRDPCALYEERFGTIHLLRVIAHDQPDQKVRVKGAHACAAIEIGCRRPFRQR